MIDEQVPEGPPEKDIEVHVALPKPHPRERDFLRLCIYSRADFAERDHVRVEEYTQRVRCDGLSKMLQEVMCELAHWRGPGLFCLPALQL